MYFGVRSAICLAVMLTVPSTAFADAPVDPQKLYAQAKAGDVEAMCDLSKLFYLGEVIKKDLKASFAWAEAGAKLGAARCINSLGVHYTEGIVVPKDDARALTYYQSAADAGFVIAQRNLGSIYLYGQFGQDKNPSLGKEWYTLAAKQGDAISQQQLGFLLLKGDEGVKADLSSAFTWFIMAAKQDDPLSQLMAGKMLAHGEGTTKNPSVAVNWLSKAAAQGLAGAQVDLGIALINGTGIAKNAKLGITWLEKAAAQQDALPADLGSAHAALAAVFQKGIGVPANTEKARQHWKLAADFGNARAHEALAALDKPSANGSPTAGEALGGLILLGIMGAMASGGNADSGSDCDLPSYTANWSQAAKDYECWQRNETARFEAERERQRQESDTLMDLMLLYE